MALPTFDRTFPGTDPLGGARLPNWDGVNNDGDNLNGDGEGDTLYLDDIAKFGFDIDMRSTGTDPAGKSWNAGDFPKQNINTYTVGFAAANQMLSDAARLRTGQVLPGDRQRRPQQCAVLGAERHHLQGRFRWQRCHQRHHPGQQFELLSDHL